MSLPGRTSSRSNGRPSWRSLGPPVLAGLFALVAVLLTYQLRRSTTIHLGYPPDIAFTSAGFYADEADVNYRYRWTRGSADLQLDWLGSAPLHSVSVRVQGVRPPGVSEPVTVSLSMNGEPLEPATRSLSGELETLNLTVPDRAAMPAARDALTINSTTFRPEGDARTLGIKVSEVTLIQGKGANLPPLTALFWPFIFAALLFYMVSRLRGRAGLVLAALALLALAALLYLFYPYWTAYLPPVVLIVAITVLAVRALSAWPKSARWSQWAQAPGSGRGAEIVLLAAMVVYGAVSLWTILNVDWIGHADYAENAVIARSLVEGRGFTVDYAAQFYSEHPGISHPAETWPLLQPLLIAPFLLLLGPETWAAKLPNLFVQLALVWAVFLLASRIWDRRVGLLAALLTLLHPYFFNSVLYPINDLAFTLIFLLLAWSLWRQFAARDAANGGHDTVVPLANARDMAVTGALAGLLIWSKPSGAVLLAGLGLWVLWTWWRSCRPSGDPVPWRGVVVAGAAATLVLLPLLLRNMLAFGKPFFTTESYDAWILRFWPFYEWENIYRYYIGGELPHPRWILGGKFGYQNLFDAVAINFRWVWQRGIVSAPGQGDHIVGVLPLAGALLGLATMPRRAASILVMVAVAIGMYALFVLVYWHFEGRYFQVAVPWLYMLLAGGVAWLWDRLREHSPSPVRVPLLILALASLLWPMVATIRTQIEEDTRPTGFATAMQWLEANSTPSDVVMTRDPWELNWYTRRRAVMIPFEELSTIEAVARKYGVTMLQIGGIDVTRCPDDPNAPESSYPTGERPALGSLHCGKERPGYELVYRQRALTIYRLSRSDN